MSQPKDNQNNKTKYLKYSLLLLSIILFIISLFQPAFFIDRKDSDAYSDSLFLFALGWMSFFGGGFIPFLIWLANPLYIISLFLINRKSKTGIITISISIFLALIFANLNEILTSESGSTSKITELGVGYFLWISSFIVLFINSIINLIGETKKTKLTPDLKNLIDEKTKDEKIFAGTTVNERLYLSGLLELFDKSIIKNKETAKYILEKLKVDEASIEKIIKDCR